MPTTRKLTMGIIAAAALALSTGAAFADHIAKTVPVRAMRDSALKNLVFVIHRRPSELARRP